MEKRQLVKKYQSGSKFTYVQPSELEAIVTPQGTSFTRVRESQYTPQSTKGVFTSDGVYVPIIDNVKDWQTYHGNKGAAATTSGTAGEVLNEATYAIPIVGTARTYYDFYKNPNLENAALAAASTVGDVGTLVGAGELLNGWVASQKAGKYLNNATKAVNRYNKAYTDYTRALNHANRANGRVASYSIYPEAVNMSKLTSMQKEANAANKSLKAADKEVITSGAKASQQFPQAHIRTGYTGTNTLATQGAGSNTRYTWTTRPYSSVSGETIVGEPGLFKSKPSLLDRRSQFASELSKLAEETAKVGPDYGLAIPSAGFGIAGKGAVYGVHKTNKGEQ